MNLSDTYSPDSKIASASCSVIAMDTKMQRGKKVEKDTKTMDTSDLNPKSGHKWENPLIINLGKGDFFKKALLNEKIHRPHKGAKASADPPEG